MREILSVLALIILLSEGAMAQTQSTSDRFSRSEIKNRVTYTVDLSIKDEMFCALLYKNDKIEEVYNIVITEVGEGDAAWAFADTFVVDKHKNRIGCFHLVKKVDSKIIPNMLSVFDLELIKFEPESDQGVDSIIFKDIKLSQIPVSP